ncbi:MAG TPA: thioredoxin domain-containing protein [Acidimicrobiales bacterium]|nr:thioredoxin domain-containing protein [Acidimicrobiales bacterium]
MNRLADQTSPYLRQHQDNPVDWYPWGEEAFGRASAEERPVLLSVGYSACHWCHVMAHESFEDAATAAVMNELFVNVKVDREERPDVDAVYMEAVQAMTGSGGWPMTVFLTPDGRPFFAGTYFPPEAGRGMPAFVDVLRAVAEAWQTRREDVLGQADQLMEAVAARSSLPEPGDRPAVPARAVLDGAYQSLRALHDDQRGGFGPAPKFPQPAMLELLLRAHAHNASPETLAMVTTTLDAMASGGIYDHLGGGFARYSVDANWLVPHFEKMLYDQAGLVRVYLHGWQHTGSARWMQVVEETVAYVLRDLGAPGGGLYSAEDADSEGHEGRFYVWTPDQIREVLGPERAEQAGEWWGVTAAGNFEGANILHRPVRGDLLRPAEIEATRQELFAARSGRVRPGLDDKVLTEWNAMFCSALAEAAWVTGRSDWLDAATGIGRFLLAELRPAGRWMRSWQGGRARHPAYASDHAWLVDAFVRLAEATGRAEWTAEACAAADALLELFWDPDEGGLFTTGRDAEALIVRAKDYFDSATPSANSVAAGALLRLAALTGQDRYRERAEAILGRVVPLAANHPTAFTHTLAALDLMASGAVEIVVTGERPDLLAELRPRHLPTAVLAWGEPSGGPLWESRAEGFAYVCRDYSCLAPAASPPELADRLAGVPGGRAAA